MVEKRLFSEARLLLMVLGVRRQHHPSAPGYLTFFPQPGQAKKPRLSKVITDDEEDEEEAPIINSFSQRLTRFKKSPVKKGIFARISSHFVPLILLCRQVTFQSVLGRRRLYCAR